MSQPHPMCCPCSSLYSLYISITSVEWPFPSIFLCALDGSDEDSFHLSSSCWCSLLGSKKHESNHKNKPHCPHSKAETSPILMLFVVFSWFSCMFVIVCVCVLFLSCGLKIQPHSPAALSRNRACWKAPVMVQQSVPQFCSSVPIPCLLQTHLDTDLP